MKKFILTTEYTEPEILQIIENCVQKTFEQELHKVITLLTNSPPLNHDCRLLTRKELKSLLRLSYPSIANLTAKGILKAKIIGGSYRYLETDVRKYLNETKNSNKQK